MKAESITDGVAKCEQAKKQYSNIMVVDLTTKVKACERCGMLFVTVSETTPFQPQSQCRCQSHFLAATTGL